MKYDKRLVENESFFERGTLGTISKYTDLYNTIYGYLMKYRF